jgi:hypothetical protein
MNLSDTVGRLTHGLAYLGLLLFVFAVPMMVTGTTRPLWVAALLIVVPALMTLLQLALSRSWSTTPILPPQHSPVTPKASRPRWSSSNAPMGGSGSG